MQCGVLGASDLPGAAGHTEASNGGTTWLGASLVLDVHYPILGATRADLRRPGNGQTIIAGVLGAAPVGASLVADVHLPALGVSKAESAAMVPATS